MTIFNRNPIVKNIPYYLGICLTLLVLTACGGGGGGGEQNLPAAKTTATLKISMTGTLPASTAFTGMDFTVPLPANVTPKTMGGIVDSAVVTPLGAFADSTLAPQIIYTAATSSVPGTLRVILTSSVPAGVTQVGEVASITLQLANGAEPAITDFTPGNVNVIDVAFYNPVSGMGASVASLVLQ